jgi:hypothetical protein
MGQVLGDLYEQNAFDTVAAAIIIVCLSVCLLFCTMTTVLVL